jgi:hypothetical protein
MELLFEALQVLYVRGGVVVHTDSSYSSYALSLWERGRGRSLTPVVSA